jgi:predicted DCC family thiol-disulfide oxidoreductase YuxK
VIIDHFDIFRGVLFKDLQTQSGAAAELQAYDEQVLLDDLYAVDLSGKVYSGVDTYIQIFAKMRYMAVFSWCLRLPGVYQVAKACYRRIADNRERIVCDASCLAPVENKAYPIDLYTRIFERYAEQKPKQFRLRMAKVFVVLAVLQLNSSIHYGFLYRFYNLSQVESPLANQARALSNAVLMLSTTFLGITPHALYLHDHFAGYEDLIAITYIDAQGKERWLPFVNDKGRMLAPNWGRVHSMWANIAVTPNINSDRLSKFIMKVTAFWGTKVGLDLNHAKFIIKHKAVVSPVQWRDNLRKDNLSGEWDNIGTVIWRDKKVHINLSGLDRVIN